METTVIEPRFLRNKAGLRVVNVEHESDPAGRARAGLVTLELTVDGVGTGYTAEKYYLPGVFPVEQPLRWLDPVSLRGLYLDLFRQWTRHVLGTNPKVVWAWQADQLRDWLGELDPLKDNFHPALGAIVDFWADCLQLIELTGENPGIELARNPGEILRPYRTRKLNLRRMAAGLVRRSRRASRRRIEPLDSEGDE